MSNKFVATNKLEESLMKVMDTKISLSDFINIFMASELILPSAGEIKNNGKIVPLIFNKENQSMLSTFTSIPLLEMYKEKVKNYLVMSGKEILKQMPVDIGLVINPGYSVGFDISAEGIKNIINDFIIKGKY